VNLVSYAPCEIVMKSAEIRRSEGASMKNGFTCLALKIYKNSRKGAISVFFVAVICLLTVIIYTPLSTHQFLTLDDQTYVTANSHVLTGLTLENIKWAFTTFHAEFWHPLTWLSYMLDTSIFGVRPDGYLLTNLMIHILNTIMLFYALRVMTGDLWASAMVALFFSVHPLHVEAVAWIAERKELLSGFFFMLCLLLYPAYLRKKGLIRYVLLCFLFACGIMAKPMIITLPFVLLLLDFWPLNRISPRHFFSKKNASVLVEKIPLFILSAIGAFITIIVQVRGGGIVSANEYSIAAKLANAVISYGRYLKKIFYPNDLAVFYPFPNSIPFFEVFFCATFLLLVTLACILLMRRNPCLIVGWLWFLGMLFPVSGLVKIGDFAMADRFTYLPLTGIFIMIAFGTRQLVSKVHLGKLIYAGIFLILTLIFSTATFFQVGFWKNSETLYLHAIDVTSNNFLAHYGLGSLYAETGWTNDAIYHFMKAVNMRPDKALLWNALGRAFIIKNLWGRGKKCFAQAISRQSDDPQGYYLMGVVLTYEKIYDRAGYFFSQSLEKYLRMKGCGAIDTKPLTAYQIKTIPFFQRVLHVENNFSSTPDEGKICELAPLISTAHRFLASGRPEKALVAYGIPKDKSQLRNMAMAGFDTWPKTLMISYFK